MSHLTLSKSILLILLLGFTLPGSALDLQNTPNKPNEVIRNIFSLNNNNTSCDEGYSYCWYACLEIDPDCPAEEQVCENIGGDDCCTGSQDEEDCIDMDETCHWRC